jgi:hypothetical protein
MRPEHLACDKLCELLAAAPMVTSTQATLDAVRAELAAEKARADAEHAYHLQSDADVVRITASRDAERRKREEAEAKLEEARRGWMGTRLWRCEQELATAGRAFDAQIKRTEEAGAKLAILLGAAEEKK